VQDKDREDIEIDEGNTSQVATRILETDDVVKNYARGKDSFTRNIKN
jgi:hypothetical protein